MGPNHKLHGQSGCQGYHYGSMFGYSYCCTMCENAPLASGTAEEENNSERHSASCDRRLFTTEISSAAATAVETDSSSALEPEAEEDTHTDSYTSSEASSHECDCDDSSPYCHDPDCPDERFHFADPYLCKARFCCIAELQHGIINDVVAKRERNRVISEARRRIHAAQRARRRQRGDGTRVLVRRFQHPPRERGAVPHWRDPSRESTSSQQVEQRAPHLI